MDSLPRRVIGIIRRPRPTFARIITSPSWLPVLVATFLIMCALLLSFTATDVGRQAFVDQWERTRLAFGQSLDDTEYARMEARSVTLAPIYAVGSAVVAVAIGVAASRASRVSPPICCERDVIGFLLLCKVTNLLSRAVL